MWEGGGWWVMIFGSEKGSSDSGLTGVSGRA